jgi:aspartate/methionine/tyrosine aminotransferase
MAGAKVRFVPLEFKDGKWSFNQDNLKSVLSDKTKVLILNNAHNPTGKLFTDSELHTISDIIKEYPHLIVLSDDVYEYLVFDGKETILFASIADNWNRTVSVFSGGKLFSATGWKVGWGIGPADIINAASIVSTTTVYCINAPA